MAQQTFHGVPIAEAARAVGFSYVAVWRHAHGKAPVSPKAALLYEQRIGIPREVLRPDLWPSPVATISSEGEPTDDTRHNNSDGSPADLERIPF